MTANGPVIYLIAGEQSGDVLGARLIRAMRSRCPEATIVGIGGQEMAAEGVESLFPIADLAIMGLLEVLPRIRRLKALLRRAIEDVEARKPDVLVTIDSPGFTLRVLGALRDSGFKRAHYVAPQVWAWRENRVKHYPGLWNELLCLLPFEPAFFARHGLSARFVGHPVLESGAANGNGARFRAQHGVASDARILTVMPGSRHTEVSRLLPILQRTLRLLPAGLLPVVPLAGPVAETVRQRTAAWPVRPILVATAQEKFDAFAASTAALTKSGTSTLELAVARVPMVVMYRVNPISHVAVKLLAKVQYASILNLLLDDMVVPEFLQYQATPERLAGAVRQLLDEPGAVAAQRAGFDKALTMLRPLAGAPSDSAAEAVLSLLAR
jgi:lipid-A-disaccharide synthase